jgi:hypothetical protein
MLVNDNPPTIKRIDTTRADAYAFDVAGHVTAPDIENMYGLLEGAYEIHDKIDLLVRMSSYEGFDWSAAFKETTMIGKTHALRHIRKYAVVGGPVWIATMMTVFKPFMSMDMRHFEADQEAEAWTWLDAQPAES